MNPVRTMKTFVLAIIAGAQLGIANAQLGLVQGARRLRTDTRAQIEFGSALGIIGTVIGAVITFIVLAALFGPLEQSARTLVTNFTNFDVGEATSTSIAPVFAIVLAISVLLGLVGIALAVFNRRGGLGGS